MFGLKLGDVKTRLHPDCADLLPHLSKAGLQKELVVVRKGHAEIVRERFFQVVAEAGFDESKLGTIRAGPLKGCLHDDSEHRMTKFDDESWNVRLYHAPVHPALTKEAPPTVTKDLPSARAARSGTGGPADSDEAKKVNLAAAAAGGHEGGQTKFTATFSSACLCNA